MDEVLKRRRAALGLSQAQLALQVGVDARQIRRYESGEQQPVLSVAVALAKALGISLSELASIPPRGASVEGDWWAAWQTYKDGEEVITSQPVRLKQDGNFVQAESLDRGISIEDGGYNWRGELRLWDNEILMGWYAAVDGSVRSKGTLYFALHPHGQQLDGRWVGLSHDGLVVTGVGAMARAEAAAIALVAAGEGRNGTDS